MPMPDVSMLAEAAIKVREAAYAPYSGFAVGAALLAEDGTVYTGCNVENAAYGVSNCAERTALYKAVSCGAQRFKAIAVAGAPAAQSGNGPLPACPPCGVCRQALYEFGGPGLAVVLALGQGRWEEHTLGELLPMAFGPENLEV